MSAWGTSSPFRSCDTLIKRIEQNDPALTDLVVLPNKNFGANEVGRLCDVLERRENVNTYWRSLSASGHSIPVSSLSRLGKAVAGTKTITFVSIAIGDSNMGDEGVIAFCEALAQGSHALGQIDLSVKGFGVSGFLCVLRTLGKSSGLKRLNLSRNPGIGETDLVDGPGHARYFENVHELDMSDCGISGRFASQLFPTLRQNSDSMKRTLRLSNNPFGVEGFAALKDLFASTESLYLSNCQLCDEGIEVLTLLFNCPSCPTRTLDLSQNAIGKLGVGIIARCISNEKDGQLFPCLEELDLSGNWFGPDGTALLVEKGLKPRRLSGCPPLKLVDLSRTNCGVSGACRAIKEGNVTALRLFNNNLGSEGFYSFAALIRDNGLPDTMESLDLAGNRADTASVVEVLEALLQYVKSSSAANSHLESFVIGGNEGGQEVEAMVRRIKDVRPAIDIARDKALETSLERPPL